MNVERPMRAYRRERDMVRTVRRTAAWMQRFHDHGDAGVGEVPELLSALRRTLRRWQEESA